MFYNYLYLTAILNRTFRQRFEIYCYYQKRKTAENHRPKQFHKLLMSPNKTIYVIHQSPDLLKAWRELSEKQKRQVLQACETAEENEVERIIEEVIDGQRRLF